ncbi:hypothetical protein UP10_20250 [Bradyrhizobium sp. LTSPM299]|nr:hypothetical protein UP10_20250 [Bradyrhizobium sp. LTSPM299]
MQRDRVADETRYDWLRRTALLKSLSHKYSYFARRLEAEGERRGAAHDGPTGNIYQLPPTLRCVWCITMRRRPQTNG